VRIAGQIIKAIKIIKNLLIRAKTKTRTDGLLQMTKSNKQR
jgi:hypothetical protein